MATRKSTKTPAIDPDQIYDVTLSAPITIGRTLLRPRDRHRLRGVHVSAHTAEIAAFAPAKSAVHREDG